MLRSPCLTIPVALPLDDETCTSAERKNESFCVRSVLFDGDATSKRTDPCPRILNMPEHGHLMRVAPCGFDDVPLCIVLKITRAQDLATSPLVQGYGEVLPPAAGQCPE